MMNFLEALGGEVVTVKPSDFTFGGPMYIDFDIDKDEYKETRFMVTADGKAQIV